MVNSDRKRFDTLIRRITSVGRYVGIHLILSTRYVSAKVISTTIYSNTPTKIALEVDTPIASRIAIDHAGEEKLLGKGDMPYANRSSSHQPIRVQGACIGDHDVDCIVSIIDKIEAMIK